MRTPVRVQVPFYETIIHAVPPEQKSTYLYAHLVNPQLKLKRTGGTRRRLNKCTLHLIIPARSLMPTSCKSFQLELAGLLEKSIAVVGGYMYVCFHSLGVDVNDRRFGAAFLARNSIKVRLIRKQPVTR